MDDTKQQALGSQPVPAGTTAIPQTSTPPQSSSPIGGPHKEFAPRGVSEAPVREYIQPHASEAEPQIHPEAKEAGVEAVESQEQPKITVEQKAAGVEHANPPVVIAQTQSVQLPYTPVQVQQILKETSVTESKHWLAKFTEYLLKKLQSA